MDDDDWDVYRDIPKESESEGEQEEQALLQKYTDTILEYSTTGQLLQDPLIDPFNEQPPWLHPTSIFWKLKHGVRVHKDEEEYDPEMESRLYYNVERIRVPQVFYEPSIAGIDQAGIGECFEYMVNGFLMGVRDRLCKV